ncbi:hypothetical protein AMS59_21740 [Lysinibacillus sp. FJAT-14745]|uniref:hypothetical protein n=1 Tax=Lysinibacillus sp. FJAT-14745 TaxID=1704289 RepID=UPI0006ABE88B|nr:hypothetical protein [Lysinibacillus sp. FJAT-14745]KOP69926.1 hypothetical protein AMS59_21740 [Lysinibacillus sp. FJAT-14745]
MTTTFFLFFIPLLFIAAIVLLLGKLSKKIKIWTPKRIIIGITSYIVLGLIAFLYISFFSESKIPLLSFSKIKQLEIKLDQIQKYDQEDDSSYLTEEYKKKTWDLKYEGNTLPVVINEGDSGSSINFRVRYNDNIESGKALVTYYQFPVIVEGIDLSDEVPLPNVYVAQNQLFIEALSKQQINYYRINATLGILDMNREIEHKPYAMFYSNVIVIDIPRSTVLEDSQGLF